MKNALSSLDELKQQLLFEMNDGQTAINDVCSEQIELIQVAKEKLIKNINEHIETLIQKVNDYKKECLDSYSNIDEAKKQTKKLIDKTNTFIRQQKDYLNQLKIDDDEIFKANQNLIKMRKKLEKERVNIKKALFNNRMITFENDLLPVEDIMGTLYFKNIDLGKTVNTF